MNQMEEVTKKLIELKKQKINVLKQIQALHDKMHDNVYVPARDFKTLQSELTVIDEEINIANLERDVEWQQKKKENREFDGRKHDLSVFRKIVINNVPKEMFDKINAEWSAYRKPIKGEIREHFRDQK